jgi:hypothetical protein
LPTAVAAVRSRRNQIYFDTASRPTDNSSDLIRPADDRQRGDVHDRSGGTERQPTQRMGPASAPITTAGLLPAANGDAVVSAGSELTLASAASAVQAVPKPGALLLILCGIAAAFVLRPRAADG